MCRAQQPFHEGDNEFRSILNRACWEQTLALSSSLAACHNLNYCFIFFFLVRAALSFFLLLFKWRQMGRVDGQKLKLDTLVLCLLREGAGCIYVFVKLPFCMMSCHMESKGETVDFHCLPKPCYYRYMSDFKSFTDKGHSYLSYKERKSLLLTDTLSNLLHYSPGNDFGPFCHCTQSVLLL